MIADYRNVKINSGFWKTMQQLNESVTISAVWERFLESGRIDAFDMNWKEGMENKPHFYWDSDVYKWMEGACYLSVGKIDNPWMEKVEMLIDKIEQHQEKNGYFNIYYTVCEPGKQFTNRDNHELYCAGHMFEAAVAHYEVTGSKRFLNIACRYADYIEQVFVKEQSAAFVTPGHEEIELGLVKLYRTTGEKRYLDLAMFFIVNRGSNEKDAFIAGDGTYGQDNCNPRNMEHAVGHAVRCLYLLCGMADCAKETEDKSLMEACRTVFRDIKDKKMYITGATGSTSIGEAFTIPYDLPNEKAYAETCASIALMMFANRMAKYEKKAEYADAVERAMYNGMLSGLSLSGDAFFYENPLEINLKNRAKTEYVKKNDHYAITQRQELFSCSCCPPNLNRVLASMGNYAYHVENDICYVNQFMDCTLCEGNVTVSQKTEYPYKGKVVIHASGVQKLAIRIPEWADAFQLNKDYVMQDGYAVVVNDGSEIILDIKMEPVLVTANLQVAENAGKAALTYGPIVYCMEAVDNGENLQGIYLSETLNPTLTYNETFRNYCIEIDGYRLKTSDVLYQRLNRKFEPKRVLMIPYYGFANRGESDMRVWLNLR